MPAFLIHDASGTIRGIYSYTHCDCESVKTRNTPAGMTAVDVDDSHEVVLDQNNWHIKDGKLTTKTQAARVAAAPLKTMAFGDLQPAD